MKACILALVICLSTELFGKAVGSSGALDPRFRHVRESMVIESAFLTGKQAEKLESQVKQLCTMNEGQKIPLSDYPNAEQLKLVAGVSARDFYYGIGREIDFEKARWAALGDGAPDKFPGKDLILVMLYANGEGVEKNDDLAIALYCQRSLSDVLMENISIFSTMMSGKYVEYCNHIVTTFNERDCADLELEISESKVAKEIAGLTKKFTAKQRLAFDRLMVAFDSYLDKRGDYEIQDSGTGAAASIMDEYRAQKGALFE